jgi:nitrogen-specific signal transduction histidine kinase
MNIANRISKLEAKTLSDDDFKVVRVIGETEEKLQAGIDRLLASGEALPTDHFFCRLMVSPPGRD